MTTRLWVGIPGCLLLVACATPGGEARVQNNAASVESSLSLPSAASVRETVQTAALVGAAGYAAHGYVAGTGSSLAPAGAAAVAAYAIYDPLAPNWTIEQRLVDGDTYYLLMRAKSFRTGGDGEAGPIFRRRALQLQMEQGAPGFRILNYSEGLESGTPFSHRYAEGVIHLLRTEPGRKP